MYKIQKNQHLLWVWAYLLQDGLDGGGKLSSGMKNLNFKFFTAAAS